jgi:hypothetical protein
MMELALYSPPERSVAIPNDTSPLDSLDKSRTTSKARRTRDTPIS